MIEYRSATDAKHLVVEGAPDDSRGRRRFARGGAALPATLLVGLVCVGTLIAASWTARKDSAERSGAGDATPGMPQALPNLPPPDLLRALTPQEARAANAGRPVVGETEAAAVFRLSGDPASKLRAIDCLTQAIYYEAASEGVAGGRAVAQVVLNRLRHPGYPNSVCGVVYQGSARLTGCQFSFTCDGSLARIPSAYGWARSRRLASEALNGRVDASVGHATHYHADYVLPYWADSLEKIAVIGRHVFYRLPGSIGSKAAFSQRYASKEPLPPLPPLPSDVIDSGLTALGETPPAALVAEPPKVEEDKIEALAVAVTAETRTNSPLQADLARGELILGEPTPAPKAKAKPTSDCVKPAQGAMQRVRAANLKVGGSGQTC